MVDRGIELIAKSQQLLEACHDEIGVEGKEEDTGCEERRRQVREPLQARSSGQSGAPEKSAAEATYASLGALSLC